jgi:hypothetical protein
MEQQRLSGVCGGSLLSRDIYLPEMSRGKPRFATEA